MRSFRSLITLLPGALLLAWLFAPSRLHAQAPIARGVMQGTVFLHSGELQVTAVDLDAGGRAGWTVVVRRVYRSRTIGDGPLGTWDASIFKHLRALPNGSVELHDGAGEIWLFTPQSGSASYASPAGLFLRLASSERGWVLVDQKWRITEFDQLGRMTSEGDEFAKPGNFTAGNTIRYLYGQDGQLAQIIDPMGRATAVTYYANDDSSPGAAPGHVREITDWRGRKVTYLYDDQYRLTEVRLPAVANATSGAGRPTIRYGYHPGAANYNDDVELGPNLVSITDPNEVATSGTPRVTFSYVLTGPNRDRIEKETWATGEIVSFTYVSPTQVDVKDAPGQIRSYTIAGAGREARITALVERQVPTSTTPVGQLPASVTATAVPASQQDRTWLFEYDAMRLLRKRTLAGVAATEYVYQPAAGAPGVVLASATTTPIAASPGVTPIAHTFTYQAVANGSTFLQAVAANGLAFEKPEPHRNKLEPQATNSAVTSTEKYDISGRLIEVTSSGGTDASGSGALLKIKYRPDTAPIYARGEIEEITRGDLKTKFDAPTPDRTVVTDPRGVVTTTDYDTWRRPVHVTIAGPDVSTDERLFYDASGRLVRHERLQGAGTVTTTFELDAVGRLKRETSDQNAVNGVPASLTTTTAYDLANRKIVTTLPSGATITRDLDTLGRTTREVTATGGSPIEHRYAYDMAGNQVYESDLLAATARAFDAHGREIATLHADGTRTARAFDAWNRATKMTTLNDTGSAVVSERTQAFTPAGRLASASTKVDAATTRTMDIEWDGGNRTTGMSVSGRATRTSFDASGRALSSVTGAGSAASVTTPFLTNAFISHTGSLPVQITSSEKAAPPLNITRQYDATGNVTLHDVGGLEWRRRFDDGGNLAASALPRRSASTFDYDGHGMLTKETLPDGAVNEFEYKASGALAKYLDPVSEPTAIDADLIGRPLKRTYADGTIEELSYDGPRRKTFTDRQGRTQVFTYNSKDQLTRIDRAGGPQLDQLDYDDAGRLIRWTNKDASLFAADFNLDRKPGKTITTHFRGGSGFASPPDIVGAFIQEHRWDEHGERVEWTMPRGATFTTTLPWTDRLRATSDAMGNLAALDRQAFGATSFAPLLTAGHRNAGRPNVRTLTTACGSTSCTPANVVRQYSYDTATGLLEEVAVTVGPLTIAGSRIAFDGLQIQDAQLLGMSNGTRVSHWSYDARSRLKTATVGRDVTQQLTPADFRSELTRTPRFDAPTRATLTARGIDVDRLDPPSQTASEAAAHKIATVSDGASVRTYSYNGSERKDDGAFEYEWDEKGRIVRATGKLTVPGQLAIMRVTYAHDGNDRMIGRTVEVALTSSTPLVWQLATPALLTDGIPAAATFIWDPITDRIAAIFDSATGALVRQVLHGDLAYDDPIEVTLLEPTSPTKLNRLYPLYDEAATGHLEAVLNVNGDIVSRKVVAGAYGDDAFSIAGAAIDRIALRAKKNTDGSLASVDVTVRASEQLRSASVPGGARLAALDAGAKLLRTASVPATLTDGSTARFTLTSSEWNTLVAGASSLSIAATNALRAEAWSDALPVLPPPEWARATKPVFSSPDLPVEVRESLASVTGWLATIGAGAEGTITLYEVADLAIAGSDTVIDDPARFLVSSFFHALPFMDSVTRHSLARARWLDHHTGTFLSPDPMGYADSANLYAFCGGDPVNGRDPSGRIVQFEGSQPEQHLGYRDVMGWIDNPEAKKYLRFNPATRRIDVVGISVDDFIERFKDTAAGRLGEMIRSAELLKIWAVTGDTPKGAKFTSDNGTEGVRWRLNLAGGGWSVSTSDGYFVLYDRDRLPAATLLSDRRTLNVVQTHETTIAHEVGGHAYQNMIGFRVDTGVITVSDNQWFGVPPGEAAALYSENLYRKSRGLPPRKKYRILKGDWAAPEDIEQWFHDVNTGNERPTPGYPNVFEKP